MRRVTPCAAILAVAASLSGLASAQTLVEDHVYRAKIDPSVPPQGPYAGLTYVDVTLRISSYVPAERAVFPFPQTIYDYTTTDAACPVPTFTITVAGQEFARGRILVTPHPSQPYYEIDFVAGDVQTEVLLSLAIAEGLSDDKLIPAFFRFGNGLPYVNVTEHRDGFPPTTILRANVVAELLEDPPPAGCDLTGIGDQISLLDTSVAGIESSLMEHADDALRLTIETNLASSAPPTAFLYLPAQRGGKLELVQGIVHETFANLQAAGISVSATAIGLLATGDELLLSSQYRQAYISFAKAYRNAVN